LRRVSGDEIHQRWAKYIICLQALLPELLAYGVHLLRIETLLDDAADEGGELRLLPSLLVTEFNVNEVQALEWMVDDDATEEVDAALLAGIALDGR